MDAVLAAAVAATRRRRRLGWTPAKLAPAFWGSGDSATADGSGNLTAWPSLMGSMSGAPGTAAPTVVTVNSKRWVRFAAASSQFVTLDALAALLTGSDVPYTLAVSLKLAAADVSQWYFSAGAAASAPKDTRGAASTGSWRYQRRDDATTLASVDGAAAVDTSTHVHVDTFSGTTASHYIDGAPDFEDQACDVGALSLTRVTIGARRGSAIDQYLGGDIRQIVIVPGRVITASERAKLTEYLAADAGVTLS